MTQARSREDTIQQDVQDLHRLGYAQELFRSMGGFSNFAISFSIISILTGAVILYDYGLAWAGTAAVMIGWPLVTVFVLLIAASMAEIASAYPTAGGLYYWASKMKNKAWGWWTAWFNLIGQFAIVAGIDFAAAAFLNATIITPILAAAGIDYGNTSVFLGGILNGQLVTMGLILLIQLAMNIAGIRLVSLLNQVSVWWHIVIVVAVVILVFVIGQPDKSGLTLFAIQPLDQGGSWNNNLGFVNLQYGPAVSYPLILAFFFSLLQANWTYTGYDASAHVAEETVGARKSSAWGVFLSVAVSAVVGYLFLVALTTHLPDLSQLFPATLPTDLSHASQYYFGGGIAVLSILEYNLNSVVLLNVGLGDWLAAGIAMAMFWCGLASVAAAGRMLYAFSRDDGIPGSRLAEDRLAPLPDAGQRVDRDRGRFMVVHGGGRHRRRRHRDRHRDGHLDDLPVRGVRHLRLPGGHHDRVAQGARLEPGPLLPAGGLDRPGVGRRPDDPVLLPHVGQHLVAVHAGDGRPAPGVLLRLRPLPLQGSADHGRGGAADRPRTRVRACRRGPRTRHGIGGTDIGQRVHRAGTGRRRSLPHVDDRRARGS